MVQETTLSATDLQDWPTINSRAKKEKADPE
jgi:hypothetical protein